MHAPSVIFLYLISLMHILHHQDRKQLLKTPVTSQMCADMKSEFLAKLLFLMPKVHLLQDQDRKKTSKAVSTSQTDAEMADQDLAKLFVLTPSKTRGHQDGRTNHHASSALTDNLRAYDEVR